MLRWSHALRSDQYYLYNNLSFNPFVLPHFSLSQIFKILDFTAKCVYTGGSAPNLAPYSLDLEHHRSIINHIIKLHYMLYINLPYGNIPWKLTRMFNCPLQPVLLLVFPSSSVVWRRQISQVTFLASIPSSPARH